MAVAAALSIASLTRVALNATIPRPMPGNRYRLLTSEMGWVLDPMVTGANGLPVPTRACPSVQVRRSAGEAHLAALQEGARRRE
jgi:hypothetical protein